MITNLPIKVINKIKANDKLFIKKAKLPDFLISFLSIHTKEGIVL